MLLALSIAAMLCALLPCSLFVGNLVLYRRPAAPAAPTSLPPVAVLIPARNEALGIADAVQSVLSSTGVTLEVIVMDDASTDATAALVEAIALRDPRVRLLRAPALPSGWNGKQHACWALAHAARYDVLCFVDADVRLAPDALSRMLGFLDSSGAALVSGFPRQITTTTLEWLLLPLIHFILLGLLPLAGMRRHTSAAFAAGCGQFLMLRREPYFATGGHSAIRETMHDGLRLPRLLRQHNHRTDLADITGLATCRMYTTAAEVWRGLSKNATEGIATPGRILPISLLLFTGEVVPYLLLAALLVRPRVAAPLPTLAFIVAGITFAALPRFLAAWRFRQPLRSALLHPVGITVLLALQWNALWNKLRGRSVTWRARSYTAADATATVHPPLTEQP